MFRLWTNARADAILVSLLVSAVEIRGSSRKGFSYRLRVMRNREKIHITEVIPPIGLPSGPLGRERGAPFKEIGSRRSPTDQPRCSSRLQPGAQAAGQEREMTQPRNGRKKQVTE